MLALVAALTLTQASLAAPTAVNEPAPGFAPDASSRSAGLFSSPQVAPPMLAARISMGVLFGSFVGGALAGGVLTLGGLFAFSTSSAGPLIVAAPLSLAILAIGTALGAAMFGENFGKDFADALVVALVCSTFSVGAGVALFFLLPIAPLLVVIVATALVFPAVATPLFVQLFKDDGPQAALTLATF
jgi:hypothetical protein